MCISCIAVSHVFDDSEDEFEDDYTESMKVINELESKLEPEPLLTQKFDDVVQSVEANKNKELQVSISTNKNQNILPGAIDSNSAVRTRSSNRLKVIAESKNPATNTAYEGNGTIEVLMEEMDEDQEIEYVIADAGDNDEAFNSNDSNDELNTLMVEDAEFDNDPFDFQNINKNDELNISEESMGDKSAEEEETGDAVWIHF